MEHFVSELLHRIKLLSLLTLVVTSPVCLKEYEGHYLFYTQVDLVHSKANEYIIDSRNTETVLQKK